MIIYFPNPYVNEFLYSIIARYSSHMGNLSKRKAFKQLFNITKTLVSPEFYCGTEILAENLKHFSNITSEMMEKNHSTSAFYKPLVNSFEISNILYKSRSNDGWELTYKEHLHYCKDCLMEQFDKYGEGYWCRQFQIPGYLVCTKHKKFLSKHPVNMVASNKLFIPNLSLLHIDDENESEICTLDSLILIAENIDYFFQVDIPLLNRDEKT